MKYKLTLPLILLLLIGCETEKADMIIHNGAIYTMNDLMPTTEAVAIRNGKIIALGKYRDLDDLITPKTKIINLNGAMMTPGLIEGHGHFYGLGLAKMQLDLSTAESYAELVSMVSEGGDGTKASGVIIQIILSKDFKRMIVFLKYLQIILFGLSMQVGMRVLQIRKQWM